MDTKRKEATNAERRDLLGEPKERPAESAERESPEQKLWREKLEQMFERKEITPGIVERLEIFTDLKPWEIAQKLDGAPEMVKELTQQHRLHDEEVKKREKYAKKQPSYAESILKDIEAKITAALYEQDEAELLLALFTEEPDSTLLERGRIRDYLDGYGGKFDKKVGFEQFMRDGAGQLERTEALSRRDFWTIVHTILTEADEFCSEKDVERAVDSGESVARQFHAPIFEHDGAFYSDRVTEKQERLRAKDKELGRELARLLVAGGRKMQIAWSEARKEQLPEVHVTNEKFEAAQREADALDTLPSRIGRFFGLKDRRLEQAQSFLQSRHRDRDSALLTFQRENDFLRSKRFGTGELYAPWYSEHEGNWGEVVNFWLPKAEEAFLSQVDQPSPVEKTEKLSKARKEKAKRKQKDSLSEE